MRTVAALCALVVALACATAVHAQPGPLEGRYVALGCVSAPRPDAAPRPAAPFILTDTRGETPTIYRLEGDAEKLKFAVGQTVEVAGSLSPGVKSASDPIAAAPLMKVQAIKRIATTCRDPKKQ